VDCETIITRSRILTKPLSLPKFWVRNHQIVWPSHNLICAESGAQVSKASLCFSFYFCFTFCLFTFYFLLFTFCLLLWPSVFFFLSFFLRFFLSFLVFCFFVFWFFGFLVFWFFGFFSLLTQRWLAPSSAFSTMPYSAGSIGSEPCLN